VSIDLAFEPQAFRSNRKYGSLAGLPDGSFDNVLCETVIMHLAPAEIVPAVARCWRWRSCDPASCCT
jgi:hypothetical protein